MLPREITWEDGRRYEIDRVTDIRRAPSLKAGGQGDRYTVMIKGKRLRRLAEDNTGTFSIYNGNRYMIIRPKFEEYLAESSSI